MGTAGFVLLLVAVALGVAGAVTWLVLKLLAALGGTARLAARYGAATEPPGTRYSGQTIAIGPWSLPLAPPPRERSRSTRNSSSRCAPGSGPSCRPVGLDWGWWP